MPSLSSVHLSSQLFDEENYLNQHGANHYIFTTEAHIIPLMSRLRKKIWEEDHGPERSVEIKSRKSTSSSKNELIKIDRDLVPIESNLIRRENQRINRTSVSIVMIFQ